MFHFYLTIYLIFGFGTALATMRIFPPMEGFKPGIGIQLIALAVFTVMWPILITLALWYLVVGHLGRTRKHVAPQDFVSPEPVQHWQGTKPR